MPSETPKREQTLAIGKRIRALREAKGISQRQLGPMVGLCLSVCGQWEMGRSMPSLSVIHRIAPLLGTTAEYLWTGRQAEGLESREERAALQALRALPPARRRAIITLLEIDQEN